MVRKREINENTDPSTELKKGVNVVTKSGRKLKYHSQVNLQEHCLMLRNGKQLPENANASGYSAKYYSNGSFELDA